MLATGQSDQWFSGPDAALRGVGRGGMAEMGRDMKPVLLAFVAATIWGLWWIPVRFLETLGLSGAAGGVAMNAGAFVLCGLWIAARRRAPPLPLRGLLGAVLVGVAMTTYSAALNYAEVVRVILLFYLAPAWSKIIEWRFMGVAWTWRTTLALATALLGAMLVLGAGIGGGGIAGGDILAVASGMAWSAGAALIFATGRADVGMLTLATALSAVLVGLPFLWLGGVGPGLAPGIATGAGIGMLYALPIMLLTLWSAQRLAPATLSFLLTAEILSGTASGVLLLDEPFSAMQAMGAALIVLAAMSEVLIGRTQART